MERVYADLIKKGLKTLGDVREPLRERVLELLVEMGVVAVPEIPPEME